jgi:tetratricopeptide (TPR) repeat protein
MNAILREYVSKGLFLGLWAYLALVHPAWDVVGRVLLYTGGGLALGLLAGVFQQISRGYRPRRNFLGFLLLVLLDSPFFIYLGLLGGLGAGLVIETDPPENRQWLAYCIFGGVILGFGFAQLRQVKDRMWRLGLGVVLGAAFIYLALTYLKELEEFNDPSTGARFGLLILIALPFFYILTFCAEAEESEVEVGTLCALLGIGLYLVRIQSGLPEVADKLIFLVPLLVYFIYATRVLPGLRGFKHTMRGYGYFNLGRVREAVASFGRALQLDPKNELAKNGLVALHRKVDVTKLDAETVRLLNFDICVAIAQSYLVKDGAPTATEREEAVRLLDTAERYKPELLAKVDYLKAVAYTHAKDFDLAAGYLARLLNPEEPYQQAVRKPQLYLGWDLALRLHPEIVRRLGEGQLALPGRRMEAIAATERQLKIAPDDPSALELRRSLYSGLGEVEFLVSCQPGEAPVDFNYEYVEQLGLALVDDPDSRQAERGAEYLRMAGRGLPERGPSIFTKLADASEKRGQTAEARGYLDQVKRAGLIIGINRLAPNEKQLFFTGLRKLVEMNAAAGDFEAAAADQELFIQSGHNDLKSMRRLAELYAQSGDVLNAVRIVESALIETKTDADFLAKKDSYYYSLTIERVQAAKEKIASWFDVPYCLAKANGVVNQKEPDLETLEYGAHMAKLARAVKPELHSAMVVEARILLRKGERDTAISLLEDVREQKRGSGDEEDAWFLATRILADLYLNELDRPDLAVQAYTAYREYSKSGGETLFQLGKAYEAAGNVPAAIKSYEAVTAYEKHPRYYDATEAVSRLKNGIG